MDSVPPPAPALDDVPAEGLPPWPTVAEFHAMMDEAEAQEAAGDIEAVDIVAEIRQAAADLRAEIARRPT